MAFSMMRCVLIVAAIHLANCCFTSVPSTPTECKPDPPVPPAPAGYDSKEGYYRMAAVATDVQECSSIGADIMGKRGGSVVDAAIASLLCVGVYHSHTNGIGGGFIMTIYDAPRNGILKEMVTLTSREVAPAGASRDMFVNTSASSTVGGMAIAVPGEIKGYYAAWTRYGRLPWSDLFQPMIRACREGVPVRPDVWRAIDAVKADPYVVSSPYSVRSIITRPDGSPLQPGDLIRRPKLADTFERIAADPESFYTGALAQDVANDIRDAGGIITQDDLRRYNVTWKTPVSVHLENGNLTVYGPPPPSSAIIVEAILNILDGYNWTGSAINTREKKALSYHRILEAFKFAYAKRTVLADDAFVNVTALVRQLASEEFASETRRKIDDTRTQVTDFYEPIYDTPLGGGTSHLSLLGPDGSAVAVTSTINLDFGSLTLGPRTGIIFNNQMDDFSSPGTVNAFGYSSSPANYIVPGKRPLSSVSPIILLNSNGTVAFSAGASGGSMIITATAQTTIRSLWFNMTIKQALDEPRIHHQLMPNIVRYDKYIDQNFVNDLRAKGHNMDTQPNPRTLAESQAFSSKCDGCLVGSCRGCVQAASDARKQGAPDGY